MKFSNTKFLVLVFLIAINFSFERNLLSRKKTNDDEEESTQQESQSSSQNINTNAYIGKLFISGNKKSSVMCSKDGVVASSSAFGESFGNSISDFSPKKQMPKFESQSPIPVKKPNSLYNKPGFEDAAYFWDYMDSTFQGPVVNELNNIWNKAKGIQKDPKTQNPYSIKDLLLYFYVNGANDRIPFDPSREKDEKKMITYLKKYNPNIDSDTLAGITIPQIEGIYTMLGMTINTSHIGWQKIILDTYDFNGDGSWNAEEFLFFVINENKERLDDNRLFGKVIKSLIDPIFDYLDCDSDGNITTEGIWVGLRELIRKDTFFDIYKCKSSTTGKPVRTGSVGDVVLKGSEVNKGYLNKKEWRKIILLAYWDRHVSGLKIFKGDENNLKSVRWIGKSEDTMCEVIPRF